MLSRRFWVLCVSCEARGARRLDADEDRREVGLPHELQQLVVLGDVQRHLGHELERVAVGRLPGGERTQELLGLLLVPDEVVVHDEDVAQAEAVDLAHLGHDLRDRLRARPAAVHDDDVAELAVEGAAAGELDRHRAVAIEPQQVEARQRRVVHARLLGLPVLGLPCAGRIVAQEARPGVLGLVHEEDVDLVAQLLRAQGGEGPSRDDELSAAPELRGDLEDRCVWMT